MSLKVSLSDAARELLFNLLLLAGGLIGYELVLIVNTCEEASLEDI